MGRWISADYIKAVLKGNCLMQGNCEYELWKKEVDKKVDAMPSIDIVRCKECKHFHYDMPYVIQGIPILGHEVCDFWGDGCKTNENGFCSYAEQKERETSDDRTHNKNSHITDTCVV